MSIVASIDPRTGSVAAEVAEETTAEELDAVCRASASVAAGLEEGGRRFRAGLLRALASALEADGKAIMALADRETALGVTRLTGELSRTCYQLRLFSEVLDEGSYLEAAIDHAGHTPMGPRPDLRQLLVPIGPVAVFGAANFPLAFSVPGGDTASALAAGCPVIAKAHPAHPATSQRCFQVMSEAARKYGAADGILALVYGQDAGTSLVQNTHIQAVGFTGSAQGGMALSRLASSRPDPIPFYGELSSLNPVVVTPAAAAERGRDIAAGLVTSFTLGAGQFCTKPGLVFLPSDEAGRALGAVMEGLVADLAAPTGLSAGIRQAYEERTAELVAPGMVDWIAEGRQAEGPGFSMRPVMFAVMAGNLSSAHLKECFGPATMIVFYQNGPELLAALNLMPGSLATAVHLAEADDDLQDEVVEVLRQRSGRLVFNGYPTGVAVGWAQHHGGPWPATNSLHTSVGAPAIRRFLRPVAWQDAPQSVLPRELRDGPADIPRRIDGKLTMPD